MDRASPTIRAHTIRHGAAQEGERGGDRGEGRRGQAPEWHGFAMASVRR